jgi:hypothetical protein
MTKVKNKPKPIITAFIEYLCVSELKKINSSRQIEKEIKEKDKNPEKWEMCLKSNEEAIQVIITAIEKPATAPARTHLLPLIQQPRNFMRMASTI